MVPPAPPWFSMMTVCPSRDLQRLRHQPRRGVGRAAGRKRHDQLDRLLRIGLRRRHRPAQGRRRAPAGRRCDRRRVPDRKASESVLGLVLIELLLRARGSYQTIAATTRSRPVARDRSRSGLLRLEFALRVKSTRFAGGSAGERRVAATRAPSKRRSGRRCTTPDKCGEWGKRVCRTRSGSPAGALGLIRGTGGFRAAVAELSLA